MKNAGISSLANIHPSVKIGNNCVIEDNVTIGSNCVIHDGAIIHKNTTLGDNNKVFSYAIVGSDPQAIEYNGEDTYLIVGNNNTIREFVTINRGILRFGGKTHIGDNNLFMAYVHIAHDCKVGNRCIFSNAANLAGHVEVGNDVTIGGLTPIHQFVKIGSYAMLAGASAISHDVPPYMMMQGNRAYIRGLNRHKLRTKFTTEEIDVINSVSKSLFSGKKGIKDIAKEMLEKHSDKNYIKELCQFIIDSKRGIRFKRNEV